MASRSVSLSLLLVALCLTAWPALAYNASPSMDPSEGAIRGKVTYVIKSGDPDIQSTTTITIQGTWRRSGSGWNPVCGDKGGSLKDPVTYIGLEGTLRSETVWEDTRKTPPEVLEGMTPEERSVLGKEVKKYQLVASRPVSISVADNNGGKGVAGNYAALGCVSLGSRDKRFAFGSAWFSTMNNMVRLPEYTRTQWNEFGELVPWTPPTFPKNFHAGIDFQGPFDSTSSRLSGSKPDEETATRDAESHGEEGHQHEEMEISWDFSLEAEKSELVVVPVDYEDWLPQAGPDEKLRGNSLRVQAMVVDAKGQPATRKARHIRFELVDVSREPGVALNHPRPELATNAPDLRFEESLNPELQVGDDGMTARTREEGVYTARATVSAFDSGAWGTLRVVAELYDSDTPLVGYLEGRKGTRDILLPDRASPDTRIGRAWKRGLKGFDKPDTWDDEAEPVLDGGKGDGLSFYEEYRGLRVKGQTVRLSPRVKELILEDPFGKQTQPGLDLFRHATKLSVLAVEPGALPESRVVNANHGHAHHGPQHGLRIREVAFQNAQGVEARGELQGQTMGEARPADAGKITSPKTCTEVVLARELFADAEFARQAVAHEVGHALGAHHHGDYEEPGIAFLPDERDVAYYDEADKLIPLYVNGKLREPFISQQGGGKGWKLPGPLARPGGQMSGDLRCIMIYRNLYDHGRIEDGTKQLFFRIPYARLPPVEGFCTGTKGTSLKLAGRTFAVFGDAGDLPERLKSGRLPLKRGACLQQMHIRDSDAPSPLR